MIDRVRTDAKPVASAELVELSNWLGEPARDLAIVAEGNTSESMGDAAFFVKASGVGLRDATSRSFVLVETARILEVVEDPASAQDDLSRALRARGEGHGRSASIETVIHAAARARGDVRFVAHTHPTAVLALLASVVAEEVFKGTTFTDELIVLGDPLFVPYAAPGLELGRAFIRELDSHLDAHGMLPSLVLLQNHGIVALSQTAEGIKAISEMAVKSARVRAGALQVGGVRPVPPQSIAGYQNRDDFHARNRAIVGR